MNGNVGGLWLHPKLLVMSIDQNGIVGVGVVDSRGPHACNRIWMIFFDRCNQWNMVVNLYECCGETRVTP